MNEYWSIIGKIKVGDFVSFPLGNFTRYGKIVEIAPQGIICLYVTDEKGGFHHSIDANRLISFAESSTIKEEEISKPKRYNKVGELECWDVIIDQKMDFLEGSILKYLWRHKQKNGPHDLKKAVEYLNKMIKDYDKLYKK